MIPDKILNQPYSLLALLLSPWKTEEVRQALRALLSEADVNWGNLLYTANRYLCTPLLYVQLRRDKLLDLLPDELREYLRQLYEVNKERNTVLTKGLKEIVRSFNEQEIPVVLLKGAATFCDDLYEDSGARMMQDLDLLVKPENLEKAGEIMRALGYKNEKDRADASNHSTHLPPFFRPGSQELVELHHTTQHNWAGAILPLDRIWKSPRQASLEGIQVHILPPAQRLYHNAAHALVAHHTYIRSDVSLLHLLEFAHIADRYRDETNWGNWLTGSKRVKLGSILAVYLSLAQKLLHMPEVAEISARSLTGLQAKRIILAGNYLVRPDEKTRYTSGKSVKPALVAAVTRAYYYGMLPAWMWKHASFSSGDMTLLNKYRFLYHKLTNKKSRANVPF